MGSLKRIVNYADNRKGNVMNRIGNKVRINGMLHTVDDVHFDDNQPTYILKRDFDGSLWYAKCRTVTRFTHIKRTYDRDHANLDRKTDVMSAANEAMRRI